MLTILPPSWFLRHSPQINTGTCDILPGPGLGGDTFDPIATTTGAPALDVIATAVAAPHPGSWDMRELLAWLPWNGAPNPPLVADIRPAPDFLVQIRSAYEFSSLADFRAAVVSRRQALGEPIACMGSDSMRHSDLQTSGFTNLTAGVETWDIYDSEDDLIGAAFIARSSNSTTQQHWVLFTNQDFDDVRCVRRTTSASSLDAFLSEMADARAASQNAFQHAVEECTHHNDVPSHW